MRPATAQSSLCIGDQPVRRRPEAGQAVPVSARARRNPAADRSAVSPACKRHRSQGATQNSRGRPRHRRDAGGDRRPASPAPPGRSRAPHLVYASDDTGDVVLTYFRAQPGYVEKLLPVGSKRYVSGTAQMFDGTLQIAHPDRVVDEAGLAKLSGIDPVYPLTEGLALGSLRRAIAMALQRLPALPEWISPEHSASMQFPNAGGSAPSRSRPAGIDRYSAGRSGSGHALPSTSCSPDNSRWLWSARSFAGRLEADTPATDTCATRSSTRFPTR